MSTSGGCGHRGCGHPADADIVDADIRRMSTSGGCGHPADEYIRRRKELWFIAQMSWLAA
ncbi:MAG: hypothetical protein JXA33_11635 [Anaerolineae bacterium]|nr:hypothetical protein [Anaerolineae bacterium]